MRKITASGQTARRFFKYYYLEGELCPIKLSKFEKLKFNSVYRDKNKFVNIDYDYLQLDGSYGKIIAENRENIEDTNKNINKMILW